VKNDAYKLRRTLHRVEQGFLHSEKYARLFDSFVSSIAIHEASHAVIAFVLGVKVAAVEIKTEINEVEGEELIQSGEMIPEAGEIERLLKDRPGRVVYAAAILASTLSRDYKFEWLIEKHLIEAGFFGDNAMLNELDDESIIEEAGLILAYLFGSGVVIDHIEAVATLLTEKKVIYGSEVRKIVDTPPRDLSSGVDTPRRDLSSGAFTKKEESSWNFPNGRVVMNLGRCLDEGIPCNYYPVRMAGLDDLELVVYSRSFIEDDGPLAELMAALKAEQQGTTTQAQEQLLTAMKEELIAVVEQREKAKNLRK
jgi:hypothetical protein